MQKAHFVLGTFNNDYTTRYNQEYYDKSAIRSNAPNELELISNKLHETHFVPGTDTLNYVSESAEKFTKPKIDLEELNRNKKLIELSTAALQQSHLDLGKQGAPWLSTNRRHFTPKCVAIQRYNYGPQLQKSHVTFSLEKDGRNFLTESMEEFKEKPLVKTLLNKEKKDDLRKSHLNFGSNDNRKVYTAHQIDYQDPRLNKRFAQVSPPIDPEKYKKSNWTISAGDERDFFKSTYDSLMTPKQKIDNSLKDIATYKSSIKIGGPKGKPSDYQSEYRKNYNLQTFKSDPDEILKNNEKLRKVIGFIRGSHLKFGENKNDYETITNMSYKYDPVSAKNGRGILDEGMKKNLMSSHYQLGIDKKMEKQTSNRRDYVEYPGYVAENRVNNVIKTASSINLGDKNVNRFEGETIYMSDFIEKPIPQDDNEDDYM